MLRIGAHMSVAGGVSKAVDRAVIHGCEALQIFTKNANRWQSKPLDPGEIKRFRRRIDETGITPVVSHASYLINLATTVPLLRSMSVDALVDELDRAHALGLLGVVIHPGTCTAGTEEDALRLVGEAVRDAFRRRPRRKTMVLLEHTAGQGRTIGHRFEQLIGRDRLRAFHANDSKRPCGSRVDRHEHIGNGCLGLEPFRWLLHDERFVGRPLLIETEKTADCNKPHLVVPDPLDRRNLDTLRRLRDEQLSESA